MTPRRTDAGAARAWPRARMRGWRCRRWKCRGFWPMAPRKIMWTRSFGAPFALPSRQQRRWPGSRRDIARCAARTIDARQTPDNRRTDVRGTGNVPLLPLLREEATRRGLLQADVRLDAERVFALVRDMPYARASSREPEVTLTE